MRKFVIILTIILFSLVACKKEDFLWNLPRVDCNFVYSAWSSCNTDNMQTRTYTSSSSGCTPPADSIQRNCFILSSVVIGTQTWTTKNLDVETYRNGDVIPQVQDATAWSNLTSGAWCYYENNTANGSTYGKLYNWYAVNDPRGLAPNGYYIPSDADWKILTDYLGGESVAGTKMKSTSGWFYNNGSNTSGFAGLPGGYRFGGNFSLIDFYGSWWSSSNYFSNYAWSRELNYSNGDVYRGGTAKQDGLSVRCLREETSTCTFVYSSWSACSNNIQTRTYASSPSGCSGTPPADSIQRTCNSVILTSVQIGNQIWTQKNLDVATYRNGDPIPEEQDASTWANLTTGAWCYFANNTANGTTYGKLYNWYAVNDARGLAPNGYHIPTDAEWTTLTTYLANIYITGNEGGAMKETGLSHWLSPNTNATNSSGFTGLPGGYRNFNGNFDEVGLTGSWWSSSEAFTFNSWYRYLAYNDGNVFRVNWAKQGGFSVRCIKD